MTASRRAFDEAFWPLHAQVARVFGEDACDLAAYRARDRVLAQDPAKARHVPFEHQIVAFEELWMDELRRLLVAH